MSGILSLQAAFDFSKTESQSFLIHSIRLAFLLIVFFITFSFQVLETRIDALEVFYPVYVLIGISFSLQIAYFAFFKTLYRNRYATSFLFFFESFYITGLIYYIGIQQSILIFLYLVNLILYGILFQRRGGVILALWTSVLFSFIVSLDTSLEGNTAYLAVGVNNLAFFTVAYLSGFLSEQLNIMGEQLKEKVRDVATLKNLNELILKNMNSGLVTVDSQNMILQMNPKASQLLGINREKAFGQSLVEKMPGLDIDNRTINKEFDLVFTKENEKRLFNVNISGLFDESGSEQGKIVNFEDETHLRALEKRVRQSEKMAAIGGLAAGIAHEIRNPLAGISGSIQLLQVNDGDVEQGQKLMGIVVKEIDRLNNLITEFLDYAKPEAPKEDQVSLSHLLNEILEFSKTEYPNVKVETEFESEGNCTILGNRDKLKQAFLNIIVNAFQAMDSSDDSKLRVSVKKNGNRVVLSIKDNGSGMSDDLKERIFEPFHTTKHKGTGLGLAITHSIIDSHGADIQVESQVGQGTEFRIQFKGNSQH